MKKKRMKSILIIGGAFILMGSALSYSAPGSVEDPLVTLSYVNGLIEERIEEVKSYIDSKISKTGSFDQFEVVEIKKGELLVGKAGTEIILRGGKATAHGVEVNRGLSDITAGKDIDNEKNYLPANHLLIVPRDDGRGVYGVTDCIFLIRGGYEIR
ncbi:MAG: hypothetical protein GX185_03445 [Tissierellia bacterium]|nr:hypothetical protein [Tissierellia bacterium]